MKSAYCTTGEKTTHSDLGRLAAQRTETDQVEQSFMQG